MSYTYTSTHTHAYTHTHTHTYQAHIYIFVLKLLPIHFLQGCRNIVKQLKVCNLQQWQVIHYWRNTIYAYICIYIHIYTLYAYICIYIHFINTLFIYVLKMKINFLYNQLVATRLLLSNRHFFIIGCHFF